MKTRFATAICLLGALCSEESPGAELVPEPVVHTSVKIEVGKLIRQDIQARVQADECARLAKQSIVREEVLELPRVVVTEKKPPDLTPPPKEPRLQEFFRTGTILQNRSGSIRLWMKGDQGLMLTFPF